MIEIETLGELDEHLARHGQWNEIVLQGLDLTGYTAAICKAALSSTTFLGCVLEEASLEHAFKEGALLFPRIPGKPFNAYRGKLYTVAELYDGFDPDHPDTYEGTLDRRIYLHWRDTGKASPPSILETLARRLHDHAMTNAMKEVLVKDGSPRKVVAIMGGHGLKRTAPAYANVARISRTLTRKGFFMVSGGGPGAMEATHLGAWLAPREDNALEEATTILAEAPDYKHPRWLATAFEVRRRFPLSSEEERKHPSMGIPTWLYGHEPPNAFATLVAKYFANSVREAGLLSVAKHGVVFAPGSAGTIQEIFQDACQNHYRTNGVESPMIFLDEDYWTREKPVYPLLRDLAKGREYARFLSCTDEPDHVVEALLDYSRQADSE